MREVRREEDVISLIRRWEVELSLPRVEAVGRYKMTGTVPPNLDLGSSEGDERLLVFTTELCFKYI